MRSNFAVLLHIVALALCLVLSYSFRGARYSGGLVSLRHLFDGNARSNVGQWQLNAKKGASMGAYEEKFKLDEDYDSYEEDDSDDTEYILSGQGQDSKKINDKEWMFFDVARISVKGGDGGDGCMAMRREYCIEHGGPSGGNGGDGGSVYLECDSSLNTLAMLRRKVHHKGKDGTNGKGDSRHGIKGQDAVVHVPPGTIVRDRWGALAGELSNHGERMLVAKGGRGGRGNEHFKNPQRPTPNFAEKGEIGLDRWLHIELKLIADVGLVGVPNAGKSTLLASVSNAKPKIADYPFTTVVPNLGVCDLFDSDAANGGGSGDGKGLVIADIPGLLEGAHEGKGLGLAFLRHIQRCRVLIHVLRGDSEDVLGDFVAINQELELFNPKLANKTQVVVVNKIDIPEVRERLSQTIKGLKKLAGHTRIVGISAATGENVRDTMMRVKRLVDALPRQTYLELLDEEEEEDNRVNFDEEETEDFEIITDPRYPGQFRVAGKQIERIVAMTNWDYYEASQRFVRIIEAQGISDALEAKGAQQGDLIMIGDYDFDFWDRKNRWVSELGVDGGEVEAVRRLAEGGGGGMRKRHKQDA